MNQEAKLEECLDEDDNLQNGIDYVLIPHSLFENDEDKTEYEAIAIAMYLYANANRQEGKQYLTELISIDIIRMLFYKTGRNKSRNNEKIAGWLEQLQNENWIEAIDIDDSGLFRRYKLELGNSAHGWMMFDRNRLSDIMRAFTGDKLFSALAIYGEMIDSTLRGPGQAPVSRRTVENAAINIGKGRRTVSAYIEALNVLKILEYFNLWEKGKMRESPRRRKIVSDYRDRRALAQYVKDEMGDTFIKFDNGKVD